MLNNVWYDRLKWFAMIGLPALGALYFGLAPLWDLPKADEVVGTTVVLDTFLGVVLGISKKQYDNSEERFDGSLDISQVDASQIHQLEITTNPEQLKDQDAVVFKVRQVPPYE